jgi:hypothetical protein
VNPRRNDYLTPDQHYQEASRLLWVVDGELQSDAPRTISDLAAVALAHAVTALAGGVSDGSAGRRLDRIRALLAGFDWELADRRYALETIERIAKGEQP